MSISNSHSSKTSQVEHVGDYIIKEKIGQGSFATVYKAQHKYTNQIVAVKSVKRSKLTKKLLENLESEISILTAIRHDHIVGLIECQNTESNIYLVMEFCSLGDLSHYIKDIRTNKSLKGPAGGLPERVVRHFLKQLANALEFLRSQNLVHRDIKPQNLLLVQPPVEGDLPILKVADFGFARFLPGANLADTLCGSPLYMGPEILSYKKYDAKADLWSVGAVLFEMVTGKPPFRAQNHIELLKKIQENNDHIQFPTEGDIGSDIKDLIRKLLKKNPVERLSFEEFFHHPAVLYTAGNILVVKRPSSSSSSSRKLSLQPLPKSESYEPPPFSQRNKSNEETTNTTRRWSFKDTTTTTTTKPLSIKSPKKKDKEDQDMLQEYVVLDRRIIETNQFADELDASPRNTTPSSPAVNIPISPSTPPFVRERKTSSASSSAGSALAKALNKASVRLFGTSIPSPPKDIIYHPNVNIPHGYMIPTNTNNRTLKHIERLSCMAHAVSIYGDQKYDLYLSQKEAGDEACILYLKSLSLLELGLNVAQQYWQNYLTEEDKHQTALLNHSVQYMRDKFNDCLKKAETIKDRSIENASVEKLLYDRALEMSRAAAVHELVGENITECEQDYQTAIWMLEAILQIRPSEEITIEEDDRRIINKFIDSIRHRITVLRKKMESSERV